jgi:hypothetical protein
MTICRYLNNVVENRKKRFTKRDAVETIRNCFSYVQPGHRPRDYPGKVARRGGASGRGEG